MNRKLIAVLALAALVLGGASAQLMIGVSGALPLDTSSPNWTQVKDQFQAGDGIYYGGFVELALGRLGFGVSANTMTLQDETMGQLDIVDADIYASFHIFGARALLDPFAELGYGIMGSQWESNASDDWADGSYYWYAAVGLGVNLGPVGIAAKFAYNNLVGTQVEDQYGEPVAPFGSVYFGDENGYLPPYRVTILAKLIL